MDNFRDSYFNITWDLTKKYLRGTFGSRECWGKQYDTGRGFAVTIVEGDQVTVPSTETVRLKWEKPDSTEGYVTAVVVDGKFLIENIDQMFTVFGAIRSDLEIWRGGKIISSATFYVSVEKALAVDAIESSSDFTALQEALGKTDSLEKRFDEAIVALTVDGEVIMARDGFDSLNARLDNSDAVKADKTYVDAQLADLLNGSPLVNILKNSTFQHGTDDWLTARATISVVNNELSVIGMDENFTANAYQIITANPFHRYYFCAFVQATSSKVFISVQSGGKVYHSGSGSFERLSTIVLAGDVTQRHIQIQDERNVGEVKDVYKVKKPIVIDLTETFGAGNEPTKAEMEDFLTTYYTDGWFSGGASLDGVFKFTNGKINALETDKADKTTVEAIDSEVILARGANPTLGARLDGTDAQLADIVDKPKIPLLKYDAVNPEVGQMWLLEPAVARDDFRGLDGEPLNSDLWEVIKTKTTASTAQHAASNKLDIRGGKAQINIAAESTISDGGKIELMARLKKVEIDWTNEKRTITWKQQPAKWYGTWGMMLSKEIPVEGGNLIGTSYSIRVIHNSTTTSLQMRDNTYLTLLYNQGFPHNVTGDTLSEFKLELDPTSGNIKLYQNGVEKLSTSISDIGITKAWLYIYADTSNTTATVRDVDDLFVE